MKRAAEMLNYTHSGLVYTLNSLEEELGLPLLNRNFRGVSLTPEGKKLEPYIRSVVEDTQTLEEKIKELISERSKELYIGAYPAIARNVLPDVSSKFMKDYPEVTIHIYSGMQEITSWLDDDVIELGICEHGIAGSCQWLPVFRDETWVAVPSRDGFPENKPVSLDDLLDYTVMMPSHNPQSAGNEELFECLPSVQMLRLDPPIYREVGCIYKKEWQLTSYMKEFVASLRKYAQTELF